LLAPHRRPHVVGDVNIHEVCERVRSLILAEFPRGLQVERDYDVSIPDFRGDREQLIQAVAQHRPQRRAGAGRAHSGG
jgi:two-component system nitrogen regulation sensor histidine kinase GlnL